eukprot:Rmarinus@m.228
MTTKGNRLGRLVFQKKLHYVYLSLFLALLLLGGVLYDFIATLVYRHPEGLPAGWRQSFLLVHIISFFFFLAGFIYSYESGSRSAIGLSLFSLVLNLLVYSLRVTYEIMYIDYHKPDYV